MNYYASWTTCLTFKIHNTFKNVFATGSQDRQIYWCLFYWTFSLYPLFPLLLPTLSLILFFFLFIFYPLISTYSISVSHCPLFPSLAVLSLSSVPLSKTHIYIFLGLFLIINCYLFALCAFLFVCTLLLMRNIMIQRECDIYCHKRLKLLDTCLKQSWTVYEYRIVVTLHWWWGSITDLGLTVWAFLGAW